VVFLIVCIDSVGIIRIYIGTITIENGYTERGGKGRQIMRWKDAATNINSLKHDFDEDIRHMINRDGNPISINAARWGAVEIIPFANIKDREPTISEERFINMDKNPEENKEAQLYFGLNQSTFNLKINDTKYSTTKIRNNVPDSPFCHLIRSAE
jgi:hypothetical protein